MKAWIASATTAAVMACAHAGPPNIVFIEVDDLTYSYLGAFGNKAARTPAIDKLAAGGFVFRHAMAQGAMCGPSRNCLITGTYPHQLGFYQNGDLRSLPADSWVFPKALREAGYRTAWIGKSHLRPPPTDKDEAANFREFFGFDHASFTLGRAMLGGRASEDDDAGEGDDPYIAHLKAKGLYDTFAREAQAKANSTLPEDDYLDGWFARQAVDFIAAHDAVKPLFLWVNFSLPHGPYDVPDTYHAMFRDADVPGVSAPENYTIPESLIERTKRVRNPKKAVADQRGYLAAIAFMDRQVGRIVEALRTKDMLDDTWIVFFSDQGVMQGSLGLLHKATVFRQITHPALIIRPPGGLPAPKVIDAPVELTDLPPTFLAVAGAKDSAPQGHNLLPLLEGGPTPRQLAFAEIEKWIAVTDGTHRLIWSPNGEPPLLFDENTDPENRVNLAPDKPDEVAKLSSAITAWLESTGPRKPPKSH